MWVILPMYLVDVAHLTVQEFRCHTVRLYLAYSTENASLGSLLVVTRPVKLSHFSITCVT